MRKEILFAIIAGGLLGLIIAFGVWRANVALKPEAQQSEQSPTPEPTSPTLSIVSPEEKEVVSEEFITLTGISQPQDQIVVSTETKDYFVQADEKGQFSQEFGLIPGLNEIRVASFGRNGASAEKTILVVYSSQFSQYLEEETSSATETPKATDQAQVEEEAVAEKNDIIRQKVEEKVKQASKDARAYLGTVTDLTDTGIQIKDDSGEILQVSIDQEEITLTKTVKTTTEVGFEDLAIGDFVIAMGFKNGNGTLEGKRILITTPPEPSTRKILFGQIAEIDQKEVTLKTNEESPYLLEFGKSWKGPEISKLEEGNILIAVGETEGQTITIRSIFLIPTETPEPATSPQPEEEIETEE